MMSRIVGVLHTSHSPVCYLPAEYWTELRRSRHLRADVPEDSEEAQVEKAGRIAAAFEVLRTVLGEVRPDVLVIFGDDHYECFTFGGFPALAVWAADELVGAASLPRRPGDIGRHDAATAKPVLGHRALGGAIVAGLLQRGFDPAFCTQVDDPARGLGHAIMRPLLTLTDGSIPVVPILLNCYYAPQVTGRRAYEIGRAVGEAIEEDGSDLRVVVIGSGGLWHTPGAPEAYIDEAFDAALLDALADGKPARMAEIFDAYVPDPADASQAGLPKGMRDSGLQLSPGPQGGSRESCNWIAAAATIDGRATTRIDYVPVYASPIGVAFAYSVVDQAQPPSRNT
jgi:hypothetical protein